MFNGIYSNATAIDIASKQHDVIANNLANANTPGFRRTLLAISARGQNALQQDGSIKTDLGGSEALRSFVDFSQASIRNTGRPLDVAINGDGFFKIQGDAGPIYTRNGAFQVTSDGNLVTMDGLSVLGGGPIRIPVDISIADIVINDDGTIRANGQELGQLDLVSFADPNSLEQVGPTRFLAPFGATEIPSDAVIQQNALESANTTVVSEMISMIVGMRHLESAQQSLKSISEAIQQFTQLDG